jgi:hypothetical protein
MYQSTTWNGGSRTYPSHVAQHEFVGRLPERKKLDGTCKWQLPTTDYTAVVIDALWDKSQVSMDADARLTFNYLLASVVAQEGNAELIARWRAGGEPSTAPLPPEIEGRYEMSDEFPLAGYQQVAMHCSYKSEGYDLFMEQGTGKTPIVIARICNEAKELREGGFDFTALRKKASQIHAQCEVDVDKMRDEADEKLEADLEAKLTKLKNSARAQASKRRVVLDYEGSAELALSHAKKAIQEVESWLTRRLEEIEDEMRQLTKAAREEVETRKDAREQVLRLEAAHRARNVEASRTKAENRMYRAIVVCPLNVRMNWLAEFQRFATRGGKVTILRGGEVNRVKLLVDAFTQEEDCDYTVIVTSYETMIRTWNVLGKIEWDLAVLDESHYIKSPWAKRFKYAMRLRDSSRQRMCLTGTPITNHPLDLYAQFEFLGKGWSGFSSWKNFRSFYGVFKSTAAGYERMVGCQNMPLMQERLMRTSFLIRKKEAMPSLPDMVSDVYEVEMGPEQADIYKQVAQSLAAEIENDLNREDNRQLVITNVLTKLLRLAQITSGFVTWDAVVGDDGEEIRPKIIDHFPNNPKIAALIDMLKDKGPNDKTLIWACWVPDIKQIAAALREANIDCVTYYGGTSEKDREEAVRRFNCDPHCTVFIGNAAAGGVGLNLLGYDYSETTDDPRAMETNASHVIYFSMNWSPTTRSQSQARPHRRGTRVVVRVTDLCVADSIDEEIRTRVCQKIMTALEISDVRQILKNVLEGLKNA